MQSDYESFNITLNIAMLNNWHVLITVIYIPSESIYAQNRYFK